MCFTAEQFTTQYTPDSETPAQWPTGISRKPSSVETGLRFSLLTLMGKIRVRRISNFNPHGKKL